MIVGTAGHIDHGKTSLVKALTGVDTDRLKEEKARGITIELGFAYWPRSSGQTIGFVDVPGHERLVRTMLAGATGIDFILLAIAADDGVMPQTREHLAILDLLQIPRGVVVLTKADTVSKARIGEVEAQVRAVLAPTVLAEAPIIATSVRSGEGIAELTSALDAALAQTRARSAGQAFRLGIDRVFSLAGAGTVVTGTMISGKVSVGDQVVVSPSGVAARVRSIHALNKPSDTGSAGQRCALALTGPGVTVSAIPRGELVIAPHLHAPASRIDARLAVLASETKPLGQWLPVRVHFAATEALGHLVVLRDEPLQPGETDYVQLVLEKPVAAAVGDRFILRDAGAMRTIGGGRFIDLRAPARHRRTAERRAELDARADVAPLEALKRLALVDSRPIDLGAFMRDQAATPGEAEAAIKALALVPLRVKTRTQVVGAERWQSLRRTLLDFLTAERTRTSGARETSDAPGVEIERLRRATAPRFTKDAFAAVLAKLRDEAMLVLEGGRARLPQHQRREVSGEQLIWERVKRQIVGGKNFTSPRVREIASAERLSDDMVRRLCKSALKRGEVREVATDLYYTADSLVELAAIVRELAGKKPDGRFTVAEFRDRLGCGRKAAMHILEFFDTQNFTMHREDWRRLNPHGEALFRAVERTR